MISTDVKDESRFDLDLLTLDLSTSGRTTILLKPSDEQDVVMYARQRIYTAGRRLKRQVHTQLKGRVVVGTVNEAVPGRPCPTCGQMVEGVSHDRRGHDGLEPDEF